MARYNPILVIIHWLMAFLIIMGLLAGKVFLQWIPADDPDKAGAIGGHMTVGILVGLLLVVRLWLRLRTPKPPKARTGNALLDSIGQATHWLFYLLVASMVLTGLASAFGGGYAGLIAGEALALPMGYKEALTMQRHAIVSSLLILLIILHFAAAMYHQFFLKDKIMSRMWTGSRDAGDL